MNKDLSPLTTFSHGTEAFSLCMLSDTLLASGEWDWNIKIWDVNSANSTNTLKGHTHYVTAIVKFPFGDIVSAAYGNEVKVWDAQSFNCIHTINVKYVCSYVAHGLCILEKERLGIACADKSIRIYAKRDNYSSFVSLKGHDNDISQIVSVGSNVLVSVSSDKTIKVWNIQTETLIAEFKCDGPIRSVDSFA